MPCHCYCEFDQKTNIVPRLLGYKGSLAAGYRRAAQRGGCRLGGDMYKGRKADRRIERLRY